MDHLRPKIFLHRFSGLGQQRRGCVGWLSDPGPKSPPNSQSAPTAPDWWEQISCHNYKLPHSSFPVLPLNISIRQKSSFPKSSLGWWCISSQIGGVLGGPSAFSFVFCILGEEAIAGDWLEVGGAESSNYTIFALCTLNSNSISYICLN